VININTPIKTVHIVFKTHLDIGFTDLAQNVLDQYVESFVPKAIELAERLSEDAVPERFIWTTGSWLIRYYMKKAAPADRIKIEESIRKGHIVWHGLPFTTHSELMDKPLFEFGLSISKQLDLTYGKQTIAAKMTDVPGHSIAIVPPTGRGWNSLLASGNESGLQSSERSKGFRMESRRRIRGHRQLR